MARASIGLSQSMIEIKYNIRTFIKPKTQQVAIRVRWNQKVNEVLFITGVYADPDKWDENGQKAKKSTTHIVRDNRFTAVEINERISDFIQEIKIVFEAFAERNSIPTNLQLKETVNIGMGREANEIATDKPIRKETIKNLLERFLKEVGAERNWDYDAKEKYIQSVKNLLQAVRSVRADNITLNTMYKLRDWYTKKKYKNSTIKHQFSMLVAFLRWINGLPGYSIPVTVLSFKPNLKTVPRTVTFLHYDELQHFAQFNFKQQHIAHARDLWCFMAFTSLRYSDLCNLSVGHIIDGRIELVTQKTSDRITIPLSEGATAILERYKDKALPDGHVFNVPSNQKLNDYIKEAAKEAGLDRMVVDTYFTGTERKETTKPFHEIISCHAARRTFVSCSLAMGIPAQVVMKATGHKDYKTMKPYIETASETQTLEMEKWNRNQYRSQIIKALDGLDEASLKKALESIKHLGDDRIYS